MCSRPIHFKEGIQTVSGVNELKCPLLYFKNMTKFISVNFVKKPCIQRLIHELLIIFKKDLKPPTYFILYKLN